MREFTGPGTVTIADDFNVVSALFEREAKESDAKAFAVRDGDRFVDVTLGAFCDEVRAMAAGIVGLGIEPGSAICLFSHTRYEFTILDYAILTAGCVTVPIYETDSADQVKWVATNSAAVAIVVEDATLRRNVDEVASALPGIRHTLLIDGGGIDQLREAGQAVDPSEVEKRWKAITHDQLASIVYTSGTTGLPKGCVLTHGNFASEVGGVSLIGPGNAAGLAVNVGGALVALGSCPQSFEFPPGLSLHPAPCSAGSPGLAMRLAGRAGRRCCTSSTSGGWRSSAACRSIRSRCRSPGEPGRSTAPPVSPPTRPTGEDNWTFGLHPAVLVLIAIALFIAWCARLRWPLPLAFIVGRRRDRAPRRLRHSVPPSRRRRLRLHQSGAGAVRRRVLRPHDARERRGR